AAARGEPYLVDPVRQLLEPVGDFVEADLQAVTIETDHSAAETPADDLANGTAVQDAAFIEEQDRLVVRQAGMNDNPQAAEGAAAFEATDEIVGDSHALDGAAEDELVRVQEHRLFGADFDQLHQVVGRLLNVYEGALGVAEHQELVVDPNVEARRLNQAGIKRLDTEASTLDGLADRAIGQDHLDKITGAGLSTRAGWRCSCRRGRAWRRDRRGSSPPLL